MLIQSQESMASFFIPGLILTIATIFLVRILISYTSKSSNVHRKLPPGRKGWPVIGESVSFITYPEKFVRERMVKHCPAIFQTSVAGERMAFLCGPLGNKFVFSNENKLFKQWWPRAITQALLFEASHLSSPLQEDHSFLKLDSIQHYVSIMDSTARDHLEKSWVPYKEVKVHPLAKEFTFVLACRLFINYYNDQIRDLTEPFFAVAKGILSAPVNIPGTPFNGAVKGGEIIKEKLVGIIRQRKRELASGDNVQGQDLLTKLVLGSGKNGKVFTEEEIANKIIGYLIASFYTTSNAITFVLSHLAEHRHVYDKVLEEQLEIAMSKEAGELLNWADIQKMKYSWHVVCESMRLTPPAQGGFKEVLTDFSFAGFNIPKGWKAFWTVHSTNKDPKYFQSPEKFDPSRFEGNGPAPYTFVPFGGGPRMCSGKEYARIEILVLVHNVVTRFKLKKANPNEKIIYNPEPVPVDGLPICLQPHEK